MQLYEKSHNVHKIKQTQMSICIMFKSKENIFIVEKVKVAIIFGKNSSWERILR